MNFAEGAQTVSSFKFAGRGQQETWVGDLRTTLLVVLRLRSRVQQVLEDFSAVSQTVRICRGRDSDFALHRGRDSDFALHRGRFSDFAVASDFARKILRKRCGGERIASGVGFHPENPIAGPAPKVRQRCCRSIADRVFFHHSHALPSILAWAQDCPAQSWRGHRIAPLNSGVGTGLPRCFPENAGSAVLHSTTPPDSPPGLRGKHRQCVGTHRCTPGLAARIARKTTEAHCCIAGHSRKTPAAMP